MANCQALLAKYNFLTWDSRAELKDVKQLVAMLLTMARPLGTTVTTDSAPWLQAVNEDVPCEGSRLLSEKGASPLHSLKDSKATLHSLGACTPPFNRPLHPQPQQHSLSCHPIQSECHAKKLPRYNMGTNLPCPRQHTRSVTRQWIDKTVESCAGPSLENTTFRSHLAPFHLASSAITSNKWMLQNFAWGHPSLFHESLLQAEEALLLHLEAMAKVPTEIGGRCFYSWYFLTPKEKGGRLPILDLRTLTEPIHCLGVRMGNTCLHRHLSPSSRLVHSA